MSGKIQKRAVMFLHWHFQSIRQLKVVLPMPATEIFEDGF